MSDISVQQIKEYLKNVFDLEIALYQHQQLVEGYVGRRQNDLPIKPTKQLPLPPEKPCLRQVDPTPQEVVTPKFLVASVVFALTGFFGAFALLLPLAMEEESNPLLGIILLLIAVYSCCIMFHCRRNAKQDIIELNQDEYNKYEKAMELHRVAVERAEQNYLSEMQAYTQMRNNYNKVTNEQLQEFDKVKFTLQASLTKLYSQNIVYAKYRNIVAIATIYEYFDSGRCTELEGSNGAYNMYEGEIRSNIIIASLSQIISDLGQIKNNQYALYEQIHRSNMNVTYLLSNIYNAQILTAYYAEAAAKAAAADRITYGIVF